MASQLRTEEIDPFDAIAEEYDFRFTNSLIGKAQRESVWLETDRLFLPEQRILEINCGTGVDALHLAAKGIHVVACDASARMVAVARRRRDASPYQARIELRTLPTEQIGQLEKEALFDGTLSNFSGLNCVVDLPCVAHDLARLVRPGGKAVLCLFGRCCAWEIVWYVLHGDFRKALRRVRREVAEATLGTYGSLSVRYPSVASIRRDFSDHFRLVGWKGVGLLVPPSYLEGLALRFARLFPFATKLESWLSRCAGFRALADHVLLVFERLEV